MKTRFTACKAAVSVCCASIILAAPHALCSAESKDTLRVYDPTTRRSYVGPTKYTEQLQRFRLASNSTVASVRIYLTGPPDDEAGVLHIYGHQGEMLVPRFQQPLASMPFAKHHAGREWVDVELDDPLVTTGGQIFVAVELQNRKIRWVSDSKNQEPQCLEQANLPRCNQLQKNKQGTWTETSSDYYVELVGDIQHEVQNGMQRDTLLKPYTVRNHEHLYPLSCGDIDGDGYVELATTNQLFYNNGGRFEAMEIEADAGPLYTFFWDVNNDGRAEIAAMPMDDAREIRVFTYRNGILALLRTIPMKVPTSPRAMLQHDVDHDGTTDVLFATEEDGALRLQVLNGRTMEQHQLTGVVVDMAKDITGVAIADIDRNGTPDFFCRTVRGIHHIRIDAGYRTSTVRSHTVQADTANDTSPFLWLEYSKDAPSTVIAPGDISWAALPEGDRSYELHAGMELSEGIGTPYEVQRMPAWAERQGAVVKGDLDNDGVDEMLSFGNGACRTLRIYKRNGYVWEDHTARWNLDTLDRCADGVLADVDLDGRLDIVVERSGTVEVYRNTATIPRGTNVQLRNPTGMVGAVVQTSVSEEVTPTQVLQSGRNRLIQESPIVFLGATGNAINIEWPDGGRETYAVDGSKPLHTLTRGSGAQRRIEEEQAGNRMACSARIADGRVTFMGLLPHTEARISIRTIDGTIVYDRLQRIDDTNMNMELQTMGDFQSAASGTYLASIDYGTTQCTTFIQYVK